MATSPRMPLTPANAPFRPITISPGSRILDISADTPSSNVRYDDGGIWRRLRDSGFDEDSIRRRDKAALISYIAKLEAEMYDLQHNMGLIILERKDYASKYEEARLSVESAEAKHLCDQAVLSSALAEARKREDNLKKALGVEKECVTNIEKALHEMRVECAEIKVSAEGKMAEARRMVEEAQLKYVEAEAQLRTAEALRDEARRSERAAARKLQEVESREDDLRRKITSLKSDCDVKEKELMLERQSLTERQKILNESQNKVIDGQALLNQREAGILSKSQALKKLEKELEDKKENIAAELRALMDKRSDLELNALSLSEREKVLTEKELLLHKKEQDLLVSQEKLATKEHIEVQKGLAEQELALKRRRAEFEAELLEKQKLVEEDIGEKRRAWELREMELKQCEDLIFEKEQDLEVQSRVIADKGKDLAKKLKDVLERESYLKEAEKEVMVTNSVLQKQREEIDNAKGNLQNALLSLEDEKKRISEAEKRLELMKRESSELLVLETKLKEEIDDIRAQKLQVEAEAEILKSEKAKFETEWEVIDEKREELSREEERIAAERVIVCSYLKDERDSLNLEKEAMREQYKQDLESLSRDREAFMSESQRERSEWFTKFQQERADFLLEIECRKRELEDCVSKRLEDIESNLREKERAFEEEKKRELEYIGSLKDDMRQEQERVALALKKLEAEKSEIKLDREQRDKAWAELQNLIEELQMQRLKLKEQRELLHTDREEIYCQIEQLKKLEDVKVNSDRIIVPQVQETCVESTPQVFLRPPSKLNQKVMSADDRQHTEGDLTTGHTVSWLKKCATLIFKHTPDKRIGMSLDSEFEDAKSGSVEKELMKIDEKIKAQEMEIFASSNGTAGQSGGSASEEPKVIHEVPSADEETAPLDVHESSIPSVTAVGTRKRRVDSSPPVADVELHSDGNVHKRRRQLNDDALNDSSEFKQPNAVDQHFVTSESQSERSKEVAVDNLAEVEGNTEITMEVAETEKYHPQSKLSKVDVIADEAYRCIIMEQELMQEVRVVDSGEASKSNEEAEEGIESELKKQDEDPSYTKLSKPQAVKRRGRPLSKSKE